MTWVDYLIAGPPRGPAAREGRTANPAPIPAGFVFDRAPWLVYWEATRACDLACLHCRAEAVPQRDPRELSTSGAQALLHEIARFADGEGRPPHLVITGGDPLQRPDLVELVAYGSGLGLTISVTPAGTPRLTREAIGELERAGMRSLALSLDGSTAERHDGFRGVPGSFAWTLGAAESAAAGRIPLQINTTVTAGTAGDLPAIYRLVRRLGVMRWTLFFLVATGRGRELREVTPRECERLLVWLVDLGEQAEFAIKTTEAHHIRRIGLLRMRARGMDEAAILRSPLGRGFGVRDGNGVVFVSHLGEVFPSGFLPLPAGDVRARSLVEIYRDAPLFRALRDVTLLKGRCGRCPFKAICGGSRARACAATGDALESDPLCVYEPRPVPADAARGDAMVSRPIVADDRGACRAAITRQDSPAKGW